MNVPPSATAATPLVIEFAARVDGELLTAGYRVLNTGPKPVYILTGLWTTDGAQIVKAPYPAYVALGDDGILHLAKQVPPLPVTRTVEQRIVPFAQKLEAGGKAQEVMEFHLPVEEYNPYFVSSTDAKEVNARAVVFSLQYTHEIDQLEVKPAPLEGLFQLWHKTLLTSLQTVRSQPIPLTVLVRRRTGEFVRF